MTIHVNIRGEVANETDATLLPTDGVITFPEAGRADTDSPAADAAALANPPQFATVRDVSRDNYKGSWSGGLSARAGEIYSWFGRLWVCLIDTTTNPNHSDITNWAMISAQAITVNVGAEVGIGGDPDPQTALAIHQDSNHTSALDLDASVNSGQDIQLRFLLTNASDESLDASIKATALGKLELDGDNGVLFKTDGNNRVEVTDSTLLPYGNLDIGASANPFSHGWLTNLDVANHIDIGGHPETTSATETLAKLAIVADDTDRRAVSTWRERGASNQDGGDIWFSNTAADWSSPHTTWLSLGTRDVDVSVTPPIGYGRVSGGVGGLRLGAALNPNTGGEQWEIVADGRLAPRTDSAYDIGSSTNKVRNIYADNYIGLGRWEQILSETSDLTTLPGADANTTFTGLAHHPLYPDRHVIVSESDNKIWYVGENGVVTTIDLGLVPRAGWFTSSTEAGAGASAWARRANPSITHDGLLFVPVYIGERATVQGEYVYSSGRWCLYYRRLHVAEGGWRRSDLFPAGATAQGFGAPFRGGQAGGYSSEDYWFGAFYAVHADAFVHNDPQPENARIQFFFHVRQPGGGSHLISPSDGAYITAAYDSSASARGTAGTYADDLSGGIPLTGSANVEVSFVENPPVDWDNRLNVVSVTDDGTRSWWLDNNGHVVARDSFALIVAPRDPVRVPVADRIVTGLSREGHRAYDMESSVIHDHGENKYTGIARPTDDKLLLLDNTSRQTDITQYLLGLGSSLVMGVNAEAPTSQEAFPTYFTLGEEGDPRILIDANSTDLKAALTVRAKDGSGVTAHFDPAGTPGSANNDARVIIGQDLPNRKGVSVGQVEDQWMEFRTNDAGQSIPASHGGFRYKRGDDILLAVSPTGDVLPDNNNGQDLGSTSKRWADTYSTEVYTSQVRALTSSGNMTIGASGDTGRLAVNLNIAGTLSPVGPGSNLGASGHYWDSVWARAATFTNSDGVVGLGTVRGAPIIPHFAADLGVIGAIPNPIEGQIITVGNDFRHYHDGTWRTIGSTTHTGEPAWDSLPNSIIPDVTDTRSLGSATRAWAGVHTQALRNSPNEFVDITAARFAGVLDASAVTEARGVATRLQVEQSQTDGILKFRLRDDTSASVLGNETIITDNMFSLAAAHAFGDATSANNGKVATYSHTAGRMILADPPGSASATPEFQVDSDGNIELHEGGIYQTQITPGMVERALGHAYTGGQRVSGNVLRVHPTSTGEIESVPIQNVIATATGAFDFPHAIRMRTDGTVSGTAIGWDGDGDTGIYRPEANQLAIAVGGHDGARFIGGGSHLPTGAITAVLPPPRSGYADWASNPSVIGGSDYASRWNEVHTGVLGYQELIQDSHLVSKYGVEPSVFDTVDTALNALKVRKFQWKTAQGQKRYGIVLEETGTTNTDTLLQGQDGINISDLVMMLVRGYQTLARREEELRAKMDAGFAVLDSLPASGGSVRDAVRGGGAAGRLAAFSAEPTETVPTNRQGTPP